MAAQLPGEEGGESPAEIRQDELGTADKGQLFYSNVLEFVAERFRYLVPVSGPDSGRVWCPSWFRHPEALSRLDSVWRAWEFLRFDPALGMSNWWLHHVDPHVQALMDPVTGPFAHCVDSHRPEVPLPLDDASDGLFSDQRSKWLQTSNPFDLS
jgi:hypothetical protein